MGYICEDCGDRFDTPYIVREYRGEFWGAPAYENMAYCPYCGSECIDDYRGEGSEDEIDEL